MCSGIEAATVAWHPLGWKPAWFSEIESYPNAVLKHRYPEVPNLGDMKTIYEKETFQKTNIDLLVGGTPCQSFSLAGQRGGLDDHRGNLAIEFLRLASIAHPRWIVWENVVGVLSADKGRAFGAFVGLLQKCGYEFAYRTFNARYFGIPQRRRRVILVGYLGDWRPPVSVLFEPKGVCGNSSKGTRKEPHIGSEIPDCSTKNCQSIGVDVYNYAVTGDVAATLGANCMSKNSHGPKVMDSRGIRIHTALECERLQGFPDHYTDVPFKCAQNVKENHRCRALGNSMPIPVMRWVGRRIALTGK